MHKYAITILEPKISNMLRNSFVHCLSTVSVALCAFVLHLLLPFTSYSQQPRNLPIPRTGKVTMMDTASMKATAKNYFLKGMEYRLLRDYPSSILELQLALRYDSAAVIAYAIAHGYAQIGKKDIATEYLTICLKKDPDYIPALELQAEFALDDNRLLGAMNIYEHIVRVQPANRQNRYMLARILEFTDEKKAIAVYNKLIEEFGTDEQLLERLITLYKSQKDTTSYVRALEQVFDSGSENETFMYDYVRMLLALQRYDKAVQFLNSTHVIGHTDVLSGLVGSTLDYFLSLDSVRITHNTEIIERLLTIVKKQHFFQWQVSYAAGLLAYRIHKATQSEDFFQQAESLSKSRADIILQISRFYAQQNNSQKAISTLHRGMNSYPNDYRFHFSTALLYDDQSVYDSAQKYYYSTIRIEPNRADLWAQLGIFHSRRNNISASDSCYRKGLLLSPDDALINNNLAYSFSERKVFLDQALVMAQKAVAKEPMNPSYLDTYGWVLYQMGDYDKAIAQLKQALLYADKSPALWEHIGLAYLEAGNYREAEEALQKTLLLDPTRTHLTEKINALKK